MVPDLNEIRKALQTVEQQLKRLQEFCNLATKTDLQMTEARIIAAIKNIGKPADITGLVKAGNELEAETKTLETAVNQNTPQQKT